MLAVRGASPQRIGAVLGRVCGARFAGDEVFVSTEPPLPTRKPIGVLFSQGYGSMTLALWVTYFMGLLVIYLLTGWLPTLMKDAGLTVTAAANITAMFQIGGTVGAVLVGWVMDKVRARAGHQRGLPGRRSVRARPGLYRCVVFVAGVAGVCRGLLHERRADRPERVSRRAVIRRWRVPRA